MIFKYHLIINWNSRQRGWMRPGASMHWTQIWRSSHWPAARQGNRIYMGGIWTDMKWYDMIINDWLNIDFDFEDDVDMPKCHCKIWRVPFSNLHLPNGPSCCSRILSQPRLQDWRHWTPAAPASTYQCAYCWLTLGMMTPWNGMILGIFM